MKGNCLGRTLAVWVAWVVNQAPVGGGVGMVVIHSPGAMAVLGAMARVMAAVAAVAVGVSRAASVAVEVLEGLEYEFQDVVSC